MRHSGLKSAGSARRQRRGEVRSRYEARFSRRYSHWRQAIGDAAQALHGLNHHAKHPTCRASNRAAIYALKAAFIRLLFEEGLVTSIGRQARAPYWRDCPVEGHDGMRHYYAVAVRIGDTRYCWHQPEETTEWLQPYASPHPVLKAGPRRATGAEGKALVRWVIDAWSVETGIQVEIRARQG